MGPESSRRRAFPKESRFPGNQGMGSTVRCRVAGRLRWQPQERGVKGCRVPASQRLPRSVFRALGRSRYRTRPVRRACLSSHESAGHGTGAARAERMSRRKMTYHKVLKLPPNEVDPVQIISAAHLQLRRWRSGEIGVAASEQQRRVRLIIVARDAMLRHVLNGGSSTRQSRSMLRRLAHSRGGPSEASRVASPSRSGKATLE